MSRLRWFLLGFFVGGLFQTWRMIRLPIDEYHEARMEIEENISEIRRLLAEEDDDE